MAAAADRPLTECAAGERFRIARVTDQSPEFLRYLSHAGLEIGAQGALLTNDPARDGMTLQVDDQRTTLSKEAAGKIMVR
jgi:Fe2+ transport system protein FeoA